VDFINPLPPLAGASAGLTYVECADLLGFVARRGRTFVEKVDSWIAAGCAPVPVPRWVRPITSARMTEAERAAAIRSHLVATFGERLGSDRSCSHVNKRAEGGRVSNLWGRYEMTVLVRLLSTRTPKK
jgi:hypothetical protein